MTKKMERLAEGEQKQPLFARKIDVDASSVKQGYHPGHDSYKFVPLCP